MAPTKEPPSDSPERPSRTLGVEDDGMESGNASMYPDSMFWVGGCGLGSNIWLAYSVFGTRGTQRTRRGCAESERVELS